MLWEGADPTLPPPMLPLQPLSPRPAPSLRFLPLQLLFVFQGRGRDAGGILARPEPQLSRPGTTWFSSLW